MTPSVCLSLQTHCINSIVAEFDRFIIAFSSTNSNIPKRHFEFLQRKYTKDLLTTLKYVRRLRNEYLDFIINRYTKEFDLQQFDQCDWEYIKEKLLNVGDVIAHLKLSKAPTLSYNKREKLIDRLDWNKFPSLETLTLSGSSLCNNTLISIAKCCLQLKALDVSNCVTITNKAFVSLSDPENNSTRSYLHLKTLNIFGTSVNDEGIYYILEHIPSLETIKYENVCRVLYERHKMQLEANCLASVKKYNLTSLELFPTPDLLTNVLSACTILCPHLKTLTVTLFTMEEMNLCCNFPELESVCLTGIGVMSSNIKMLSIDSFLEKSGMNLVNLELCYFSISVFDLAKSCPKLKKLELKCMNYECVDKSKISQLKFLNSLYFEDADFTDENTLKSLFLILSASSQLEILQMPYCKFYVLNENKTLINYMNLLKEINLSFTDIEVSFLKSIILSSTVLEKLTIEYCNNISEYNYDELSQLIGAVKNNVKLIWNASLHESDFSDSDNDGFENDFYDNYNDYGDNDDIGHGFVFEVSDDD